MGVALASSLAVLLVCVVLFLHPYLTYPMSLRGMRARPLRPAPDANGQPTISLLFCAYNEMAVLPAKLENLTELVRAWPELEVLAYDDASSDGTWEALQAATDVVRAVRGPGRTGKAHGMKVLAEQATGEILVFTDANVIVDVRALTAFAEAYRDPSVGGVCGRLVYESTSGGATETVGGAYWRLEELVKGLESRSGNVMGADGSIFSVRRDRYPDFPDSVQDDFTVSMSVVLAGRRLVRSEEAIAYEALVSSSQEEFRRKVRIAARAYHTHLHLRPGLRRMGARDRYAYFSHKLLRWHSATLLTLGAIAAAVTLALLAGPRGLVVDVVVAALAAALLVGVRTGPLSALREILLALYATNWGVWLAMRGRTFVTWQPPPRP